MNTQTEIPYSQWNTVPRPTNGLFTPNVSVNAQGSNSDWKNWKTWKNPKAFASQGKVSEF